MMKNPQNSPVSVLMVSAGGYGYWYLKTLFEEVSPETAQVVGVVDPYVDQSGLYYEIAKRRIPVFSTLREFYGGDNQAELTVISSPIQHHVAQSCIALKHGSNVLCDKPMAASVEQAKELIRVRDASGRWVRIGYQWSYSKAIRALKHDIIAGLYGSPRRLKTLCCWRRGDDYYRRNDWAGKITDPAGLLVRDSPANNAMAHFLHNLFFILGHKAETSAKPDKISAELYRVNPIESFDTVAMRIHTPEKVELLFYASHATGEDINPIFEFEFDDATIVLDESGQIVATDRKGHQKKYGSPDDDPQFLKLFAAIESVRKPRLPVCGPEAALSQTICVEAIHKSDIHIHDFGKKFRRRDEHEKQWWIHGLGEDLQNCYQKAALPHEIGCVWASEGGVRESQEQ